MKPSGNQPIAVPPLRTVVPEVELNVRVDLLGGSTFDSNTLRAEEVVGLLRRRIGNVHFRRFACPDGPDLLWAGSSLKVDPDDLDDLAYAVSVIARQKCVAVYLRGSNEGKLIGPQARNWGRFNIQSFRSFQVEE